MAITLIPEDGTGLSTANCYCDLAFMQSQAELRGFDLTSYDEEVQKSAIYIAANDYIDRLHKFAGEKVQLTQGMSLYTDLVTYADASVNIMKANAEAALLHLQGFLFVDITEQDSNGNIIEESAKLDVLGGPTKYEEGTRVRTKYDTSTIDALLTPYLDTSASGGFKSAWY